MVKTTSGLVTAVGIAASSGLSITASVASGKSATVATRYTRGARPRIAIVRVSPANDQVPRPAWPPNCVAPATVVAPE